MLMMTVTKEVVVEAAKKAAENIVGSMATGFAAGVTIAVSYEGLKVGMKWTNDAVADISKFTKKVFGKKAEKNNVDQNTVDQKPEEPTKIQE